jgi:hypothetical protein
MTNKGYGGTACICGNPVESESRNNNTAIQCGCGYRGCETLWVCTFTLSSDFPACLGLKAGHLAWLLVALASKLGSLGCLLRPLQALASNGLAFGGFGLKTWRPGPAPPMAPTSFGLSQPDALIYMLQVVTSSVYKSS